MSKYSIGNRWKQVSVIAGVGVAVCSLAYWFGKVELKQEHLRWCNSSIGEDVTRLHSRAVADGIKWYFKTDSERKAKIVDIYTNAMKVKGSTSGQRMVLEFAGALLKDSRDLDIIPLEVYDELHTKLLQEASAKESAGGFIDDFALEKLERAADIYHAFGQESDENRLLVKEVNTRLALAQGGLEQILNSIRSNSYSPGNFSGQYCQRLSLRELIYREKKIVPSKAAIDRFSGAACEIAQYVMQPPVASQSYDSIKSLCFAKHLIECLSGEVPVELGQSALASVNFLLKATDCEDQKLKSENDSFTVEEFKLRNLDVIPPVYMENALNLRLGEYSNLMLAVESLCKEFNLGLQEKIAIGWWNIAKRARPWNVDVRSVEPTDQLSVSVFQTAAKYTLDLPPEQRERAQCYLAAGLAVAGWKNGVSGWCMEADQIYASAGVPADNYMRKRVLELKCEAEHRKTLFEMGGR